MPIASESKSKSFSPWNAPGQNIGVGSLPQGIFPTKGLNPGLLHCWWILSQLSHKGSPRILERVAYSFTRGSSWPRSWAGVSCIAGRFLTNWAMREAYFLLLILLPVAQTSTIHHPTGPAPPVIYCWKPFLISGPPSASWCHHVELHLFLVCLLLPSRFSLSYSKAMGSFSLYFLLDLVQSWQVSTLASTRKTPVT